MHLGGIKNMAIWAENHSVCAPVHLSEGISERVGWKCYHPKGVEREKSVSGSLFVKCSAWAVYLTDSIILGDDRHFCTDEETELEKSFMTSQLVWTEHAHCVGGSPILAETTPDVPPRYWRLGFCAIGRAVYLLLESWPLTWLLLGHFLCLSPLKVCFIFKKGSLVYFSFSPLFWIHFFPHE